MTGRMLTEKRRMADRCGLVRQVVVLLTTLSILGLVPGCNDNGGPSVSVTPTGCLEFVAAAAPAAAAVVARPTAGSSCDVAAVEMIVSDVSDLFGTDFVITFDPAVVVLSGSGASATGSILGTGLILDLGSAGSGQINLGLTRTTPPGVDVVGAQLLVTLTFGRVTNATSTSALSFGNASLFDSSAPPVEIPGISWSGGTFVVTAQ